MIELEYLSKLREFYKEKGVPTIKEDGYKILLEEAYKKQPTNILEVGTATGMSATALLITCPNAHLTTIEIMERSYLEAQKNFKNFELDSKITQKLGDSLEVLKDIEGEFDFVFLDGSKSKYKKCLQLIEPHLKKGAIIVADNVLFRGYITGEVKCPRRFKTITKYMRQFLDYVFNGENYKSVMHKVGDGVSVSEYLKGE